MNYILLILLGIFLLILLFQKKEKIEDVEDVDVPTIREYFNNQGNVYDRPFGSSADFVTAVQNDIDNVPGWNGIREKYEEMLQVLPQVSDYFGIPRSAFVALVMTESGGNWHSVGDCGYWDMVQVLYFLERMEDVPENHKETVRTIFNDTERSQYERLDEVREYIEINLPDIYNRLQERCVSFGCAQINTSRYVTRPSYYRSSFDIACNDLSAREPIRRYNFQDQDARNQHLLDIYEARHFTHNWENIRNRGVFDPVTSLWIMGSHLKRGIDVALQYEDSYGNRLSRDKWVVLAMLFKYKNGVGAPVESDREQLKEDGYHIRNWWYKACVEKGTSYMSRYDDFVTGGYFDTFLTRYQQLTGDVLFTEEELMRDYSE